MKNKKVFRFQKLLRAEANRRVRMCNLQSAKGCASVETSLATAHARAQEIKNRKMRPGRYLYGLTAHGPFAYVVALMRFSWRG